ncbi:uncharacterized protein LOC144040244 [Vanacampus margaritifer]
MFWGCFAQSGTGCLELVLGARLSRHFEVNLAIGAFLGTRPYCFAKDFCYLISQPRTLNIEGTETLTAMTTIDSQTLAPESNAFGYYPNVWSDSNNYLPTIQGPFNYQNEEAKTVSTMVMPSIQPTQSLPILYCTEWQDNLQMQFAQQLTGDMTATQLQYANSVLPQGVAQGRGPPHQSERSLMKNR